MAAAFRKQHGLPLEPVKLQTVNNSMPEPQLKEPSFYYFAYGSCMCPVDLKRTLGENTYPYVVGHATLEGHRLGFYRRSLRRNCGALAGLFHSI